MSNNQSDQIQTRSTWRRRRHSGLQFSSYCKFDCSSSDTKEKYCAGSIQCIHDLVSNERLNLNDVNLNCD